MARLILGSTSMAQWQKLILEAEQACAVNLNEETESYLVFLLMRFIEKPQMVSSVLGLEFLEGSQDFSHAREEKLRDVGDKCLLLSGLFPGRAEHRCVDISYFIKLGQAAYLTLSDQSSLAALYVQLCQKFVAMTEVLQTTRELIDGKPALTPLQAYSLWRDVQSKHALRDLQCYTQGVILPESKVMRKH